MPTTIRYRFTQRFAVSAKEAFDWCTDFDPGDNALMGDENAPRQIIRITDGSIILKDTFQMPAGVVEKQKLVQLYPHSFFWTSTHLTGPNKFSQFLYAITPQGNETSILEFTALHIEYNEKADTQLLEERLCIEDAAAWKLLAKAMAKEYKANQPV